MMRDVIAFHQVRSAGSYSRPGLDEVLDALPMPVAVVDRAGLVTAANHAWLAWAGFTDQPARAWTDHPVAAIDPGDADDGLDDRVAEILAGGPAATFVRHLPGTATRRWQCRITPIADPDGTMPMGATIVHAPLTSDQAVAEQNRVACQSKSRFLADLSHEMRTPLNAIIGFADLMVAQAMGPLDNPRYRSYVGDIASCGRHLLDLVNQVLDLARVESGTLDLTEDVVDLDQIAHQACGFLNNLAGAAGISLRHHSPDRPIRVRADRRLILQILLNLLSNAQKATPKGGTITLSCGVDAQGGAWLCVADDGPGIPPELVSQVMSQSPMTAVGPRGPSGGGAGLGLCLCRRFIERHGGRLDFDAVAGQGTRVTVTLPAARRID